MYAQAFKVGMRAPDDVSAPAALLERGAFRAEHVVAILGKTEGNGAVNDDTRGHATLCWQLRPLDERPRYRARGDEGRDRRRGRARGARASRLTRVPAA